MRIEVKNRNSTLLRTNNGLTAQDDIMIGSNSKITGPSFSWFDFSLPDISFPFLIFLTN